MAYEIYIVIRDQNYPMDEGHPAVQLWEAGWYSLRDTDSDALMVIDDYEEAEAIAKSLAKRP